MKLFNAVKTISLKKDQTVTCPLKTPWTDQVQPDNVWPEYPRPQLARESFINLNGLWNYAILTQPEESWPDPGAAPDWDGRILVPFSPEAPLSGVCRQLLPGQLLWYQRRFFLESIPDSGHLLLHFQAVDQRCRIYVNGREAGQHEGGYLPFTLDITTLIRSGDNTLDVLCRDDSDTSYHSRGKQMLKRGGMFYTAQSGIWQTVWMEWVPEVYLRELTLTPDYDGGQIHIAIQVQGNHPVACQAEVSAGGKEIARLSTDSLDFSLVIPSFIPWTPENPFLYDLTIRILPSDGGLSDTISSYFAMRCFSVEKDPSGTARLCLNHKPYFHNGVLDQGYWPDGLYTAPCDEALVYDIEAMKNAGFNMLRKHCKLEPLRWYYHCDRLGMLVWQDIVNGGSSYDMARLCYLPTLFPSYGAGPHDRTNATGRTEADSKKEWYLECQDTIRLLYNCPSIASWVLFNEGWGQFDTEEATAFVRSLDGSRTIDQASGWFDHRGGDMRSVHNYFRKLTCPEINSLCRDASDSVPANRCGLRAAVISEYGGLALPLSGHTATEQVYGYKNLKSQEEFQKRFGDMMLTIHRLKDEGLSAAVYTQVSDIEDEVNGILTYDRKVNKCSSV